MTPRDELELLVESALDAEGAAIDPAPDAWERFRERRDETSPAGSSPASRGWSLAAAAVVGIGGLAAALATLTGGDGEVRTASPSADATDDASSGTTLDAVPEGATRPPGALVVTEGGDLLRVDVATGRLETLVPSQSVGGGGDVPRSEGGPDGGGDVRDDRIDAAAAGLDGTTLYSTCCEPIAGQTRVLGADGGSRLLVPGYSPAVAPDGSRFAVVDPAGVAIHGLEGEQLHRIDAGSHIGSILTVAWDPAGDRLAVEVDVGPAEHRVLLVGLGSGSLDDATELVAPTGRWWAQPVFRSDGSLLVAEHAMGQEDVAAGEGSAVRMVSPEGQPGGTIDLGGLAPQRLAADRSGRWVLVAAPTGRLASIGPDGRVVDVPLATEQLLVDVAW